MSAQIRLDFDDQRCGVGEVKTFSGPRRREARQKWELDNHIQLTRSFPSCVYDRPDAEPKRWWKDLAEELPHQDFTGLAGPRSTFYCGADLGPFARDNDVLRASLTVVEVVANVENFLPTPLNVGSRDASLTPKGPSPFRPDAFVAELPIVVR